MLLRALTLKTERRGWQKDGVRTVLLNPRWQSLEELRLEKLQHGDDAITRAVNEGSCMLKCRIKRHLQSS